MMSDGVNRLLRGGMLLLAACLTGGAAIIAPRPDLAAMGAGLCVMCVHALVKLMSNGHGPQGQDGQH